MKLVCRELYISGVYSVLYGFDWKTNEAIYRQVIDDVVYVRVHISKCIE